MAANAPAPSPFGARSPQLSSAAVCPQAPSTPVTSNAPSTTAATNDLSISPTVVRDYFVNELLTSTRRWSESLEALSILTNFLLFVCQTEGARPS